MGLRSWLVKGLVKELKNNQGSDFYQALLKYVGNSPVYMNDNVDTYINEGYLFNPNVYSIISFIAHKASTIPFGVYEVKDEKMLQLYKTASQDLGYKRDIIKTKSLVELKDHELQQLFVNPNSLQPWSEFIEQTVGYKLVTGNSYTHCIGPTSGPNKGTLKEMWTLPSPAVVIVAGDQRKPVKHYEMAGDRKIVIPPEQMIHLKYWTPEYAGGTFLYGLSPIRAGRRVVTKSNASYDTMVAAFQNQGAQGIISGEANSGDQNLTPEQAEMIKQRYAREYSGPKNKGKPIITSAALKWQQMGMSPADLAIIESDKMDLRTLCNVFHVPSELFNDASNKTYSNTKEAGSAVYTNAVIPALVAFRDALNQFIKPKYEEKIFIDFDTSMISELQDDLTILTGALSGAWWISPNERRDMMSFDMDENPLMDEYWVPSGLMPMSGAMASDAAVDEALKMLHGS